nr:immunoglobulin heavy chain junction region [Macaca mulatta]MOX58698.1 immunoglobulin heavy chain junction region [Macaca mulatta]MOX58978.1 immunoglobulin heavy chain junction region [Macaca mulatta]MOX59377.1 immunoglobulin heavy chain junction region [Macaca mulatta]MOX59395.1 immunoglobulin heavy chain junction region [Macaca mulatta]
CARGYCTGSGCNLTFNRLDVW